MPIPNYSVLMGTPVSGRVVSGRSPHYQIAVEAGGSNFTVAVNIQSTNGSEVLYAIENNFTPPDLADLNALSPGVTPLASAPGGLALDFVREQIAGAPMVQRSQMTLLPHPDRDGGGDLNDAIVALVEQVIAANGTLYAFGSAYADGGLTDGIHDIHMNQGNPVGGFERDNGIWQDGGMFLYQPAQNTWTAVFIAFQTESWNTDESGNPA